MMTKPLIPCLILLGGLTVQCSTGCVMKRTVTQGGGVISEKYVVKRPIRDSLQKQEN